MLLCEAFIPAAAVWAPVFTMFGARLARVRVDGGSGWSRVFVPLNLTAFTALAAFPLGAAVGANDESSGLAMLVDFAVMAFFALVSLVSWARNR